MAKILLVEDDNNLREIYEARLQAEGFTIVSAKDGEEALVVAKKENPDLIISDVMMPRVSGFEMLDILRNTQGFKDTKVIMLTALGQAEDQARADKLGADRYLVKSQVTLEDIVNAADELLGNVGGTPASTPVAPTATTAPVVSAPIIPVAAPAAEPATPAAVPAATVPVPNAQPTPTAAPTAPVAPAPSVAASVSTPVPVAAPLAAPTVPTVPVAAPKPAAPTAPAIPPTSAPVTAAAPQPPVPTPPAAPVAAVIAPAASDDKLMADAVHDLLGATDVANTVAATAAPTTLAAPNEVVPTAAAPTPNGIPTLKDVSTEPTIPTTTPNIPVSAPPAEPAPTAPAAIVPTPLEATPQPTQPTPAAPTTPSPSSTPVAEEPKPAEPADAKKEDEPDNDAVTIARKKIIAPLDDPNAPPQDDLNTLLAKEGMAEFATEPDDSNGQMVAPHPPGHVFSPTAPGTDAPAPTPAEPPKSNGIDPSSIAL